MIEEYGDLWSFDGTIGITTNGFVKRNGCAVMGRGCAFEAARRFPKLPTVLGKMLRQYGNHTFYIDDFNIITFPVKHMWWEKADLALIRRSAHELVAVCAGDNALINLPRPGCGNGQLLWSEVKPVIEPILTSSKFRVITYTKEVSNSDH